MLKRAFNVVKKDVGKIVFAMRAGVLMGENEPLLRAVLVQDVFVNVALRVAFCRTVYGGALQSPPMPDGHTAVLVELEQRA